MKMSKNYKHICALLGLSLVCGTGMVTAYSGSRNVKADYRNIQISYNGVTKTVTDEVGNVVEPFAINGTTYVPLRGVGQILGVSASWDPATSTVRLTGGQQAGASSADVSAYINKINELQQQLTAAQTEIAVLKSNNNQSSSSSSQNGPADITTAALNELNNKLNADFSDQLNSGIDMCIEVSQKASRLQLDITYSSSSENSKYDNIGETKIKNYIKDICDEIQTKFGAVAIQGNITYTKADLEKVSFQVSAAGKASYTFAIDESGVKDAIEDATDGYITLGELGRKTISSIESNIKTNKITFSIYLNDNYNELTYTKKVEGSDDQVITWSKIASESLVRSQLKEIVSEIEDETNGDYTITGYIYTRDSKEIASIESNGDVHIRTH